MKTHTHLSRGFEFSFPALDTLVLVEERGDLVLIRATRNSFSLARKLAFVRHLAAEGFISDEFRWSAPENPDAERGIRWVIDYTWLRYHPSFLAHSRRCLYRVIAGSVAAWLAMMGLLIWQSLG